MDNQVPPRWRYVLAIIIFIAGVTAFGNQLSSDLENFTNMLNTVVVPGSSNLNFSEPGKYTIFYEYQRTAEGGRFLPGHSSDVNLPNLECRLLEKQTGTEIALHPPAIRSTYSINGRSDVSIFDFDINRSGTYELSAWYPGGQAGQQVVLGVGPNTSSDIMGSIVKVLMISLGSGLLALFVVVDTYRKRKKASEQAEKERAIISGR
ncbi:MAG: hypothetical protein ACE14P_13125 [Methanotrichaceae archaeon]